jgi:hypothetical protein
MGWPPKSIEHFVWGYGLRKRTEDATKLDTLQNACLRAVGGFSRTTPVHVLSATRTWMTGEEMVKSVSLNTPLDMIIKKLLETHDTTSTAKFNLMEKTALKIRHLVEAIDEEEKSFH